MESPFPLDKERELIETHLELRDGATWVVGICPGCWEHVAARDGRALVCPNGHRLAVRRRRSEGS